MLIEKSCFNSLEIILRHYQVCVCLSECADISVCLQALKESKSGHILSYPSKDDRALDGSRRSWQPCWKARL